MQRNKMLDLTQGNPLKQIILFGLPMLFGNVFQQLYNLVDSYVVGNYVGANALAAVGTCGAPLMIFIGMSFGFFNGAGVVVAQLRGAGRMKDAKSAVSTCLVLMVAMAIVMTALGMGIYRWLLHVMNVPESIFEDSAAYLRIYVFGLFFLFLYNCLAALLRALGDSVTPLIFLIIACVLNIILDIYFVVKLGMAVRGVAWATFIGQAVSAVSCAVYAAIKVPFFKYKKGEFVFSRRQLQDILRLGIPSGVQTSVASIGFIFVQSLVNGFGEANIAAYTAASKMERLSHMTSESFTQALATYVGQNIGAGRMDRVDKGRRDCFLFTGALAILTSIVIFWIGPSLISLFVKAEEVASGMTSNRGIFEGSTF